MMEDLGSMWIYEQSINDMRQKLHSSTMELELLKAESNEETRKHNEDIKQLLNLLKIAYQERDEAKDQLQKLLNKLMFCQFNESVQHPIVPENPTPLVIIPTKANSSITESNSLSDAYNQQSHGSSPSNSFFDAVSSPDFSSINMADSSQMGLVNKALVCPGVVKIDPADAVIYNLIKGKALPQKGNLLQTVMEAGPLLQTILVAGPLPRWRNPPPLQPFKIPPASINGCDSAKVTTSPRLAANVQIASQKPLSSPSYNHDMSRWSTQMCSASMLNFTNSNPSSGLGNRWLLNSAATNQIPAGKRQRF